MNITVLKDAIISRKETFMKKYKLKQDNSIVTRRDEAPAKFYQILEKIDIIAQNWVGESMGSNGVDELFWLAGIFAIDYNLGYNLPPEARVFFYTLINPKNAWDYQNKHHCVFSGQLGGYFHLRQFLIDNAERVTLAYNKLYEASRNLDKELTEED